MKATLGYEERPAGAGAAAPTRKGAALRATIGYGEAASGSMPFASLTSTLSLSGSAIRTKAAPVEDTLAEDALDETIAAHGSLEATAFAPATQAAPSMSVGATRTTVLPRRKRSTDVESNRRGHADVSEWHVNIKPRFETIATLGRGGMGEVALAKDNDIRRSVAVKRLLPEHRSAEAVLRFADEVRAVGQLEHPGIVPVYDVGVDEGGQHYLVMKHVQGETLETVIEKLQQGEPAYVERFTFEHRAIIFLEIVQAIRYAHSRGIIHRDIKPANVMVGPFGEVTVMDWGIAKKLDRDRKPGENLAPSAPGSKSTADGKLLETVHGALLGTPLYMSPEQAAGRNDDLDGRSDVFSLCMLFLEFLALEHPLGSIETVQEVLAVLIVKDLDVKQLAGPAISKGAPVEYIQFLAKGLVRAREKRFASVEVMEKELRQIMSGRIPVHCHISLTKNLVHGFLHWVDRHMVAYTFLMMSLVLGVLGGTVFLVVHLVRAG